MKTTMSEEVRQTKDIIVGYKCDFCKSESNGEKFPAEWHSFESYHNEWGNDSCESYESFDVCSVSCYIAILKSNIHGSETFRIDEKTSSFAKKLVDAYEKICPIEDIKRIINISNSILEK